MVLSSASDKSDLISSPPSAALLFLLPPRCQKPRSEMGPEVVCGCLLARRSESRRKGGTDHIYGWKEAPVKLRPRESGEGHRQR